MAEAILALALRKLGDAAVKKTLYLYGAGDKLDSLRHKLDWIQAFLKDAESKRNSDERVRIWVSDVREVAYTTEDVIDTFIVEVDKRNPSSKIDVLWKIIKNPMKLVTVYNLRCEMDKIERRLREIKECAERYGINKEFGDSSTSNNDDSWNKVFEKLIWHADDGKKCSQTLETSYEDLPIVLKPCFMYFALFPEDYEVEAKSLIRIWVAERFIPEQDGKTTEETAEEYLEELVRRSMIQVSSRFHNGSIKYCRIHNLLRDYAVEKAKENRFLEVIPNKPDNCSSITVSMRRAAVHCDREDILEYTGPNLRSLSYSGKLPNANMFQLLEVFNKIDISKKFGWLSENFFGKMTQLRYLKVSANLNSRNNNGRKFWKSVSHMRNLQTVEIQIFITNNKDNTSDCDCIWDIKTLRHVILHEDYYGPPSKAHLPNLQTLKLVRVRESWVTEGWPKMPNMRVLKLRVFPSNYGESFRRFLGGLSHLASLHTYALENYKMMDMSVFPCHNQLRCFSVAGKWTGAINFASAFPRHLTKIKLIYSEIEEDPMPILEKLESLTVLVLRSDAYKGTQLRCSVGGFRHLQVLDLYKLERLEEFKAEEGAIPMLKELKIFQCRRLRLIPKLDNMPSICKLNVYFVDPNLTSLLKHESEKIREGHQFIQFDII